MGALTTIQFAVPALLGGGAFPVLDDATRLVLGLGDHAMGDLEVF